MKKFHNILLITFISFFFVISNCFSAIPLFEKYPLFKKNLPHISLGTFPTPIKKLETLGTQLGVENLYLKNDGKCGGISSSGNRLFGGNKVRKLEFLLADAINDKANTVFTIGGAGSNHALATSVYADFLNLKSILLLTPQLTTSYLRRNLRMDHNHKAELCHFQSRKERNNKILQLLKSKLNYYIPSGGSNELGTTGFVNAALELQKQIKDGIMPEPDYIYIAFGSMGSIAGLMLGLKTASLKSKVIGVRTIPQSYTRETAEDIARIFNNTASYLNSFDSSFPKLEISETDVYVNNDFFGERYAQVIPEAADAICLLRKTEKIQLDGTYTGKAFAALLHDIQNDEKKRNKVILFWDTFCSGTFSEITDTIDYRKLPEAFHYYFEEDLQPLDQGC